MARRPHSSELGVLRLDPRLAIGIVLVVASTAGVWTLVTSLDDSAEDEYCPVVIRKKVFASVPRRAGT